MIIYPSWENEGEGGAGKAQYGFILIVKLPVALTSKGFLVLFFKKLPHQQTQFNEHWKHFSNTASAFLNGSWKTPRLFCWIKHLQCGFTVTLKAFTFPSTGWKPLRQISTTGAVSVYHEEMGWILRWCSVIWMEIACWAHKPNKTACSLLPHWLHLISHHWPWGDSPTAAIISAGDLVWHNEEEVETDP